MLFPNVSFLISGQIAAKLGISSSTRRYVTTNRPPEATHINLFMWLRVMLQQLQGRGTAMHSFQTGTCWSESTSLSTMHFCSHCNYIHCVRVSTSSMIWSFEARKSFYFHSLCGYFLEDSWSHIGLTLTDTVSDTEEDDEINCTTLVGEKDMLSDHRWGQNDGIFPFLSCISDPLLSPTFSHSTVPHVLHLLIFLFPLLTRSISLIITMNAFPHYLHFSLDVSLISFPPLQGSKSTELLLLVWCSNPLP